MFFRCLCTICLVLIASNHITGKVYGDSLVYKSDSLQTTLSKEVPIVLMDETNKVNDLIEFLKSTWGTLNFWIIVLILGVNMIIGIVQLCVPFGQNGREKRLIEHKFKISKKHEYIEMIHVKMCNTLNSIFFDDININIKNLTDLKTYSGLYITNDLKSIIESFINAAEKSDYEACSAFLKDFESKYKS